MRILLLDNPADRASQLIQWLQDHHFDLESVDELSAFLSKASEGGYDALLVNLCEPVGDRLAAIQELRTNKVFTPALGFDPQGPVEKLKQALDQGFDEFLGQNFTQEEFSSRFQALLRRANYGHEPTKLTAGDISLDLLKRQVRRGDKLVELQPREFAMLEFMIRNQDRPLSKLVIMQNVWNYNFDPQTNIVDVLICRLRSKIEAGFSSSVIRTVRGVGYMFTPNEK